MTTQNSLLLGSRKYRGVLIRPALGGAWIIRQTFPNAPEETLYSCHANSLRHGRDIIANLLDHCDFIAVDGDLVKKEI